MNANASISKYRVNALWIYLGRRRVALALPRCWGISLDDGVFVIFRKNNPECRMKLLKFAKVTSIRSLRANGEESSAASRDAEIPRKQYGF